MEKSNTKRRSADATLLKVLEDGQFEDDELKDNQYPEVSGIIYRVYISALYLVN